MMNKKDYWKYVIQKELVSIGFCYQEYFFQIWGWKFYNAVDTKSRWTLWQAHLFTPTCFQMKKRIYAKKCHNFGSKLKPKHRTVNSQINTTYTILLKIKPSNIDPNFTNKTLLLLLPFISWNTKKISMTKHCMFGTQNVQQPKGLYTKYCLWS